MPQWPIEMLEQLGKASIWCALGLVVFGLAFWVMNKVSPFSIRKEIEEDQNTSLSILMGSVILGIAVIIAAAIH